MVPKKQKLEAAEKEHEKVLEALKTKQDELSTIENNLKDLQNQFTLCVNEQQKLEDLVIEYEENLILIDSFIDAIREYGICWKNCFKDIQTKKNNLVGDTLIAACFITYCGNQYIHMIHIYYTYILYTIYKYLYT